MDEPEPIRSAFHDIQESLGASFMSEGGWYWAESFGDAAAEYAAVRDGVGMWDVSPLNKWEVSGADALRAVRRVHTNDVLGLDVGQVRYGAFVDHDGLMVDDGTVFKLADDHCWVMTNARDHDGYFAEATEGLDAKIEYLGGEAMPHLQVQGPRSRELIVGLTDADLGTLRYYHFIPEQVKVGGVAVWLSRTGFSGELGYELFVDPSDAADLWEVVHRAGATPFGVEAVEVLRIESGMIVTDYDYTPHERSPYDFSFDRFVALSDAEELFGRSKLSALGAEPPNRFRTLRLEGTELPEYGAEVTRDGESVGVLTSPTSSPRFGVIGLAILRTDAAAIGTSLEVALGDGTVPATVDVVSVHDPAKRRPRV